MWKLGIVPYLNADPLAAALSEPDAALLVGEAVSVRALVPSELLPVLLQGEVDAALVSTAGVLPYPELRILPGMGVVSRGPVRSIQLFCRRPVSQVRTVALDASSRSAVALTRVLFAEWWQRRPEFITRPPHLPSMLEEADAALLIGNPALLAHQELDEARKRREGLFSLDLGQEWTTVTGLPFVYAIWAFPRDRETASLSRVLQRAKAWGLPRRRLLAARGAARLGLPEEVTLDYLTRAIQYDVEGPERAGMELFCRLAVKHGALPESAAVRFARQPAAAG